MSTATAEVRAESLGWRDKRISERHRAWGFDCPGVDLDLLLVEFNFGLPVALIEYKHHNVGDVDLQHPSYRALRALADGYAMNGKPSPLPFLVAAYWPDTWAFRVTPANQAAAQVFKDNQVLTEFDFVSRLYNLRQKIVTDSLASRLQRRLPQGYEVPF